MKNLLAKFFVVISHLAHFFLNISTTPAHYSQAHQQAVSFPSSLCYGDLLSIAKPTERKGSNKRPLVPPKEGIWSPLIRGGRKAGIFPTDTIFYHPQPLLIMEGNRRSLFPKGGKVNATCSLLEENYLARDLRRVVERSEKRTLQ